MRCQRLDVRRHRRQVARALEPLRKQTDHSARHEVQREQQQEAVQEMLRRGPAGEQCIDQRQHHGTDQRSVLRPRAAEEDQQQDEDRQVEGDEVGVDVLVLLRDERPGDAAGHRGDDEGHDLGAVDAHADRRRSDFVRLQRQQRAAEASEQQVAQQQVSHRAEHHGEPHPLQRRERLAVPGQRLDAVDALRAAEHFGPLADQLLDDDAEGQRHHRQVGALDAQRRQCDQHATRRRDARSRNERQPGTELGARGQ